MLVESEWVLLGVEIEKIETNFPKFNFLTFFFCQLELVEIFEISSKNLQLSIEKKREKKVTQ